MTRRDTLPMALPDPDGDTLLALEAQSRREGTGLSPEQLRGHWRLRQLWSRRGARPLATASALLRPLAAALTLTPEDGGLAVRNSVQLGALELCFEGSGVLRGRRPLLVFWFETLQLRLAGRLLWQRTLERPPERSLPFFALIASRHDEDGAWLAARGRGGGLALWRREPGHS